MPDLPVILPSPELEAAFLRVVDVEGKLIAALEDLGPIADRNVILLDAGRGYRARLMREIGSRVDAVTFEAGAEAAEADEAEATEAEALDRMALLSQGRADAVVVFWSELAVPGSAFVAAAERLLRPTGRLLIVHDYGRDDVWNLRPDVHARTVEWSQRRGPFLGAGFRVRVIHCWWTFESAEQAQSLLEAGFGPAGIEVASRMKRPRLEYQVAIYHRSIPVPGIPIESGKPVAVGVGEAEAGAGGEKVVVSVVGEAAGVTGAEVSVAAGD